MLREHEAGVKTVELCGKQGVSDAALYNWKAKYGGMRMSEEAGLHIDVDAPRCRFCIFLHVLFMF